MNMNINHDYLVNLVSLIPEGHLDSHLDGRVGIGG